MKKIITIWERWNRKDKKWEHNHISDGFSEDLKEPVSISDVQKRSWKDGKWRSFEAYLMNYKVELEL